MRKNKYNISALLCSILSVVCLSSFSYGSEWELKKDKDGISVYTRTIDGSTFAEFKGITVVNATLPAFVAMLKDVDSYPTWVSECTESKLLNASEENEQIHYLVSNVPFPLDDRDMVVHLTYKMLNKNTLQVEITSLPSKISEKENLVRIKEMKGVWTIIQLNDQEIQIQYQLHVEPNGSIPAWLANATAVDSPFYTLKNIENHIKNPKYQSKNFNFLKL